MNVKRFLSALGLLCAIAVCMTAVASQANAAPLSAQAGLVLAEAVGGGMDAPDDGMDAPDDDSAYPEGGWAGAQDAQDAPDADTPDADAPDADAPDADAPDDSADAPDGDADAADAPDDNADAPDGDAPDDSADAPDTDAPSILQPQSASSTSQKALENALALPIHQEVSGSGIELAAEFGYDGAIIFLRPIPVRVRVRNTGADIVGTVGVEMYRDYSNYDRYEMPVTVASGAEVAVTLYVTPRIKQSVYTVRFLGEDGKTVAAKNFQPVSLIDPYTFTVGLLSDAPNALSYLDLSSANDPLMRGEKWQTVALAQATFPTDADALAAFHMIVLDGTAASTLTQAQTDALESWVRAGGIALVGGGSDAAVRAPLFERLLGARVGGVSQKDDITPALMKWLSMTSLQAGGMAAVAALDGGDAPLVTADDGSPLLLFRKSGEGIALGAAFSLSDKPFSTWTQARGFWQRVLLQAAPTEYQLVAEGLTGGGYRNGRYINESVMRGLQVENRMSMTPMLCVLAFFLAAAGLGGYFLLKKFDRREWLWLVIPALSVGCAALMIALGGATGMQEPIAVTFTSVCQSEDGVTQTEIAVGVASPNRGDMTLTSPDGGQITASGESNYYDYNEGNNAPSKLGYRYIQGDNPALGVTTSVPWSVKTFFIDGLSQDIGRVTGTVWMEENGFRMRIHNGTEQPLEAGFIFSAMGYVTVPALLPDETAECALREPTDAEKSAPVLENTGAQPILDGVMIFSGRRNTPYDSGVYDIINAAMYPENQQGKTVSLSQTELERRDTQLQMYQQAITSLTSGDSAVSDRPLFYYCAMSDILGEVRVALDGKDITRSAHGGALAVAMRYQPVGENGIVYYPAGSLAPTVAELDAQGLPKDTGKSGVRQNLYYRLTSNPVFCFTIPDAASLVIDTMKISTWFYEGAPTSHLFNVKTQTWEAVDATMVMRTGENANTYIDAEGRVFVKYGPGNGTGQYTDVYTPSLTLDGKVK